MIRIRTFLLKFGISISIITLILGVVTIILFTLIKPFNNWTFNLNPELFSQYGNFIGGFIGTLFSFITVIFLYTTIIEQRNNNNKVSFENTFFNLLKTQQDISNSLKAFFSIINIQDFNSKTIQSNGKDFFMFSKIELTKIFESIKIDKKGDKYLDQYNEDNIDDYNYWIETLKDQYNYDNEVLNIEIVKYTEKVKIMFINKCYGITSTIYNEFKGLNEKERIIKTYNLFFHKYRYAIGHYFRHLYHIVKFVKSQPMNKNESKKYIDFIQAQMSSYELTLLFYNIFIFEKMKKLVIEFNFLDNLYENELINPSHNCLEGVILKK